VVSWNWHPDSKRVSLLGARKYGGEGLGIYTVPLSGEGAVLLKSTPEVGDWGEFGWSPSGTSLYIDCHSNAAHGLCKLEVDPSTMTVRSTQRMTAGAEFQATPVLFEGRQTSRVYDDQGFGTSVDVSVRLGERSCHWQRSGDH
jgi:hypothetical protein